MAARTEQIRDQERPLLEHIKELALRLRRALIVLTVIFFLLFAFDLNFIKVYGFVLPILYPNLFHSISTRLIVFFIHHELPKGLELININPFDTLYASAYISFFFALMISIPVIFYELWGFVAPGLYENEKRLIKNLVIPAFVLFLAGSSFAYFVIIPFMMRFILLFTQSLGVEPTLGLRAFIGTVTTLMLATGLAFEFPLVMVTLTYLGLVKSDTWLRNWRWGVMISFIIAWIISPGTTGGIIETIIGIILSSLFFVGVVVAKIVEKRRQNTYQLGYR